MRAELIFSKELFRRYLSHKVKMCRIAFAVSVILYIIFAVLNKNGIGLSELDVPWVSDVVVFVVIILFIAGISGFLAAIGIRRKTYNCQLEIEGNTVTYMCICSTPYILGSANVGMQCYHMEKVTRVEEKADRYIIYGTGIHVPDTRIMSDQRRINKFKVPKWFAGMEQLKSVPNSG